jgi:cyanophycinase
MLALAGSGEYLPEMESVDRELIRRLPAPPRVVCLPTAAGQEGLQRIGYWTNLAYEHFSRLGAVVESLPVIDRTSANDPSLASVIAEANFVYLSGGKPDYLYQTLAGSLVWEAIQSVLAGGWLLAGCSAGAMVLGERFYGFPGWKIGFNYLPGASVIPHFDEIPGSLLRIIHRLASKELILLGIEGFTVLLIDGEKYEVLGRGGVTVWNRSGKTRFTQGPLLRWDQ